MRGAAVHVVDFQKRHAAQPARSFGGVLADMRQLREELALQVELLERERDGIYRAWFSCVFQREAAQARLAEVDAALAILAEAEGS